jgi:hypothetical protein
MIKNVFWNLRGGLTQQQEERWKCVVEALLCLDPSLYPGSLL